MDLIKNYKDNMKLLDSFDRLADETFDLQFDSANSGEILNERYIRYSMVEGGEVVSNISVNIMDIMWNGKEINGIQIGTVMTKSNYRKQGLAKRLMEEAFEDYKDCEFIYLFSEGDAKGFYEKLGMKAFKENAVSLELDENFMRRRKLRKLDLENPKDKVLFNDIAENREYVSEKFSVKNSSNLIKFYIKNGYSNYVYLLEEEETIVIMKEEKDVITLFDLLCKNKIQVEDIISKIAGENIKRIDFRFTPDISKWKLKNEILEEEDSVLMFKDLSAEKELDFCFPELSHA